MSYVTIQHPQDWYFRHNIEYRFSSALFVWSYLCGGGFAGGLKISESGIICVLELLLWGGGFAGGLTISEGGIIRLLDLICVGVGSLAG